MKRLWIVAALGIAALLGYALVRQTTANRLDRDLLGLQERIVKQNELRQTLVSRSRQRTGEADVVSFVESLYGCARQTDIDDVEVTTSQHATPAQTGRIRREPKESAGSELKISRMQVVLRSDYRSIAEYLRKVDELGLPIQINRLEMTVEGPAIRMLLLIDLYSLKGAERHVP